MSRFLALSLAGALVLPLTACTDQQARDDIADLEQRFTTLQTDLVSWSTEVHDWHTRVWQSICQLEADVYDQADSGGDTRTAGNGGDNRLCQTGPGDPGGEPPPPPDFGSGG